MPKGFIMIRKKVGDDEKVLLADLIHHHIIICLHERADSNHDGPLGTIFPDTKYK